MQDKFPVQLRTFETRLLFLKQIYENKFSLYDIMASCVSHKLDRSYLAYKHELEKSILNLTGADPLAILSKIE